MMSCHFNTAYWINLWDRPDKAAFFARSIPALGDHTVQRWEGVHVWDLGIDHAPGKAHGTRGQLGCYIAHTQLWRHIAFTRQDSAVFEDDTVLNPAFLTLLDGCLHGREWEFVHLGGPDPDRPYRGGLHAYIIRWQTAARLFQRTLRRTDTTDQMLIKMAHAGELNWLQTRVSCATCGDQTVPSDSSCRDSHGILIHDQFSTLPGEGCGEEH